MLNEKNDKTKKIIHLMVTSLCLRNCPHCCNKQYDLNEIPYVTDEELKECEILCLTGGEPFEFTNPEKIARYYKNKYPNIKKIYAYTNAFELYRYTRNNIVWYGAIDGYSVSIKTKKDLEAFETICSYSGFVGKSNRLYVFDNLMPKYTGNFQIFKREWQEDFTPSDDSIFRKV